MRIRHGDMFNESVDSVVLFTANSTIRTDGCLVMGRGAADEARIKWPGINYRIGQKIANHADPENYGVVYVRMEETKTWVLGAFQVKWYFKGAADIRIIEHSFEVLKSLLANKWEGLTVSMNFPGIGYGRMREDFVLQRIKKLQIPDSVTIWKYPEGFGVRR